MRHWVLARNSNPTRTRRAGSPSEADGAVSAEALPGEDVAEADVVVVDGGVPVEELAGTHRRGVLAKVDAVVGAVVGRQNLFEKKCYTLLKILHCIVWT